MTKVKLRSFAAPAIDIRIALAQNANGSVIASSNRANILNANGRVIEQFLPRQAFQAVASNSNILFKDWRTPLAI